jgi:hypothetical protein
LDNINYIYFKIALDQHRFLKEKKSKGFCFFLHKKKQVLETCEYSVLVDPQTTIKFQNIENY